MLSCGRATARKIGEQAGAKIVIGRRVLYSNRKSQEILAIFGRIERFSIYVSLACVV